MGSPSPCFHRCLLSQQCPNIQVTRPELRYLVSWESTKQRLTLSGFGVCDLHIHFFRMVLMPSWGDGSGMSSVG